MRAIVRVRGRRLPTDGEIYIPPAGPLVFYRRVGGAALWILWERLAEDQVRFFQVLDHEPQP